MFSTSMDRHRPLGGGHRGAQRSRIVARRQRDRRLQLPDTESSQVLDLLERVSPADSGEEGTMVFAAPAGVTDPAVQAEIRSVLDQAAAIEHVVVISPFDGPGQISPDGTVAFARLQIEERQQGPNMIPAAASLLDLREEHQSQLVDIELGGQIFVDFAPPSSETIGLAGAILVLLLAFGSVLAVGLPIGIALFGVGTGVALIGVAGSVINLPDFATTLAVMIGLGVGIDYALFIVTRYREHIAAGEEPEEATVAAIDSAGRAVVFAGTIVIISMLGMLLMGVSFIRGLGIGAALAVFATMVASLTLLPALLGFVQRRIDVTTWYAFLGLIVFDIGLLGFAFGIELLLPLGIRPPSSSPSSGGSCPHSASRRRSSSPATTTRTSGIAGVGRSSAIPGWDSREVWWCSCSSPCLSSVCASAAPTPATCRPTRPLAGPTTCSRPRSAPGSTARSSSPPNSRPGPTRPRWPPPPRRSATPRACSSWRRLRSSRGPTSPCGVSSPPRVPRTRRPAT
ncbi:MAG: MMPL family transporter [Ilumatobacteraceae bacterium]